MVRRRESQDSQIPGLAIFIETGNTGGGIGFFGGKDDELSTGLGEFEVSIEYACDGFFFLAFIHSLSHCLLSTYYVPGVAGYHLPRAVHLGSFPRLNLDLLDFYPLAFFCPSGPLRRVPSFRNQ